MSVLTSKSLGLLLSFNMTRPMIKYIMKINSLGTLPIPPINKFSVSSSIKYRFNSVQVRNYASNNSSGTSIATLDAFSNIDYKDKNTYLELIRIYKGHSVHRRGHVEFIYTALKHMEEFGVEKDLEVYRMLIDVMPKGKFIPQNIFQSEFMHYPKQQQCIIDLLEQMEENGKD